MVFVIHWHESAMDIRVFPIPIPPPTSLSTRSLWVFPVHQVQALVSCIPPGLVICFTLDNIHVLMLFSWKSHPRLLPQSPKVCSVHLCIFFCFVYRVIERVTDRRARGLQTKQRGCKCQTFLSLLSGRRFLLKCCVAMTPGLTWS